MILDKEGKYTLEGPRNFSTVELSSHIHSHLAIPPLLVDLHGL